MANQLTPIDLSHLDMNDPETRDYVSNNVDLNDPETKKWFDSFKPLPAEAVPSPEPTKTTDVNGNVVVHPADDQQFEWGADNKGVEEFNKQVDALQKADKALGIELERRLNAGASYADLNAYAKANKAAHDLDPVTWNKAIQQVAQGHYVSTTPESRAFKYQPVVKPGERGMGERFADSAVEASDAGFGGLLARSILDWTDAGKEDLKKAYPGKSDEFYEYLSDRMIALAQRSLRAQLAAEREADPTFKPNEKWYKNALAVNRWGPDAAGQVLGGVGPETLINPGSTVGKRILIQGALGMASDLGYQAADVAAGVRDEYNPYQTLGAGAAGAGFQGLMEGGAKALGHFTTKIEPTGESVSTSIEEAHTSVNKALEQKVPRVGKTGNYGKKGREVIEDRKVAVTDYINDFVEHNNWKNAPEFEVVGHTNDIADPAVRAQAQAEGADKDALGFVGPDGKVRIFANNVRSADELNGVIFHEALGHYGLSQKFNEDLDHLISNFIENDTGGFKEKVEAWKRANPEGYKDDPLQDVRAGEEVLARMSEKGPIEPKIVDRVTNLVKDAARGLGVDLSYSDREIKTILGMAHEAVVNGKPSDVPSNGFRYSRRRDELLDEEEYSIKNVKESFNALSEDYEPTHRTWADAKRAAREQGLTAGQINKQKGIQQLDKRLFQSEAAARKLDDDISRLNEKLDTPDWSVADKQKYLESVSKYNYLMGRIFDDQAEVGRALNAIKALSFTKKNVAQMNEILAKNGGTLSALADDDTFLKFARQVNALMNSDNPQGAAQAIKTVMKPYWWQYLLSFRHSMMLSGLATHAKNITDNGLMLARELEESAIAVPGFYVRKGLNKAGFNVQPGVSPQEVAGRMYGIVRAALDSATYKDTAEAFMKGHGNRQINSKLEMADARIPVLSKIGDALHAQDTFFRSFFNNANLYALGIREARKKGFTGTSAFQEGSHIAQNPTPEMLEEMANMSNIALLVDAPDFQSRLEAMKAVRPRMTGGEQAEAFVANFVMPFFRVTNRLIFQKIRRSPLAVIDKVTREDIKAGGARADIAIARALYGSALIAYYWSAAGHKETEGAPPPYKKQRALEAGGYLPNSVNEGNKYTDASALNLSFSPFDLHNATAANVATLRKSWEESAKDGTSAQNLANGLAAASLSLMQTLASESFVNNLSPYVDAFKTGQEEGSAKAAVAQLAANTASSFAPAGLRQLNQTAFDTVKRDTTGDGSLLDRVYGRVASGIPGLSNKLPVKFDVYGNPQPQGRTVLGMRNYQKIKNDPEIRELQRLERTTKSPVVTAAPVNISIDGTHIKLSGQVYQDYQQLTGEYFMDDMRNLIKTDEWKKASDPEKIEMVKKARTDAASDAKYDLIQIPDTEGNE